MGLAEWLDSRCEIKGLAQKSSSIHDGRIKSTFAKAAKTAGGALICFGWGKKSEFSHEQIHFDMCIKYPSRYVHEIVEYRSLELREKVHARDASLGTITAWIIIKDSGWGHQRVSLAIKKVNAEALQGLESGMEHSGSSTVAKWSAPNVGATVCSRAV